MRVNRIIHGDSREVLAREDLREHKFSLFYADPPYGIGYRGRSYRDSVKRSKYLGELRETFRAAIPLLASDASVWVSIDDRQHAHVRLLLDELIGEDKYVATIVWQKRLTRDSRCAIGDAHEYLLVYALDPVAFKARRNLLAEPLATVKRAKLDQHGRWYVTVPLTSTAGRVRPNQIYTIVGPDGTEHVPPPRCCWSVLRHKYDELVAQGRITFGPDGTQRPRKVRYLDEVHGLVPDTWWSAQAVGSTQEASTEQRELFGAEGHDTPKPERLMRRVLHIATRPGEWVLDAYGGSGTTPAVAEKLGRKWVAIERAVQNVRLMHRRLSLLRATFVCEYA